MEKFPYTPTHTKVVLTIDDVIDEINAHEASVNNPHKVTAAQLGLSTALQWKGIVATFADLPKNASIGWVYSVKNGDDTHASGMNFAWNGTEWDDLGGTLDGIVRSINGEAPDDKGNIIIHGTPELPQTETFYKGTGEFSDTIESIKVNTITAKTSMLKVASPIQEKMAVANNALTVNDATSVYFVTPTESLTIDVSKCSYVSGYSRLVRVYIDLRAVTADITVAIAGGTWDVVKNDIELKAGLVYSLTIELLGSGKVYLGVPVGGGGSDTGDAIDDDTINNLFTEE